MEGVRFIMAFTLDPQTGKITFGVRADLSHDAIARDIAQEFNVSETFNDDFQTATNWTQTGTKILVNTATTKVDWDWNRNGANHAISHDLQTELGTGVNASDTQWTLRWKWTVNNVTLPASASTNGWIGLFTGDNASDSDAVQDFIFFENIIHLA